MQSNNIPVMVLRTDSPSPEVIRPENQGIFSNPNVMMEPVFQLKVPTPPEVVQSDMTEAGHVQASVIVLDDVTEAGKTFEETLEALDKEIERYEHSHIINSEILTPLGPTKSSPTNATPSPFTTSPLANITNLSPAMPDRKSTRLNSSHNVASRMPSSA